MSTTSPHTEPVLMRRAAITDAARIRELARLDDRRMPAGPFLVAELGDQIVAAASLSTGVVVADPFRLTADAVAILRLRAAQVGVTGEVATHHRFTRRSQSERQFAAAA